jgi:hypothetical protein
MKSWNRGRVVVGFAWGLLAILTSSCGVPGKAQAERVGSFKVGERVGNATGRLVFMLTTGYEDLWEVRLCLEDIKAAKASGYMEDVIWLVRGRGVDVLGEPEGVLRRPSVIIQLAREVKASGVRVIVSTEALQQQKIPVARLDPTATELVDDTARLMVELVSQGYEVIRY